MTARNNHVLRTTIAKTQLRGGIIIVLWFILGLIERSTALFTSDGLATRYPSISGLEAPPMQLSPTAGTPPYFKRNFFFTFALNSQPISIIIILLGAQKWILHGQNIFKFVKRQRSQRFSAKFEAAPPSRWCFQSSVSYKAPAQRN